MKSHSRKSLRLLTSIALISCLARIAPAFAELPLRSDTLALIARQTPVRDQGPRNVCIIFAATALLESMLVIKRGFPTTTDLSEEWVKAAHPEPVSVLFGPSSLFSSIISSGVAEESAMPYLPQEWESLDASPLARQRCGKLTGEAQEYCLSSHYDPAGFRARNGKIQPPFKDLKRAAKTAARLQKSLALGDERESVTFQEMKALLAEGTPVMATFSLYMNAWNHRRGDYSEVPRNLDHYRRGIIGLPHFLVNSGESTGHAVLLVGYDETIEQTFEVSLRIGEGFTFSDYGQERKREISIGPRSVLFREDGKFYIRTRGVAYFKNSWGTYAFGADTEIEGVKAPGYGSMPLDYFVASSSFDRLPLK